MIHNLPCAWILPVLAFKEKMSLLPTGNPVNIIVYNSAQLEIVKYYLILFIYVARPNTFIKRWIFLSLFMFDMNITLHICFVIIQTYGIVRWEIEQHHIIS